MEESKIDTENPMVISGMVMKNREKDRRSRKAAAIITVQVYDYTNLYDYCHYLLIIVFRN